MDFDVCKCNTGWTGSNCAEYSCERLDYCSGELSWEIVFIVYEKMSFPTFLPSHIASFKFVRPYNVLLVRR